MVDVISEFMFDHIDNKHKMPLEKIKVKIHQYDDYLKDYATKEQSKEQNLTRGKEFEKDINSLKQSEIDPISLEITSVRHIQMRDIHKFLFDLWNEREIRIVINLYREMESKQPGIERNYIYNNIILK